MIIPVSHDHQRFNRFLKEKENKTVETSIQTRTLIITPSVSYLSLKDELSPGTQTTDRISPNRSYNHTKKGVDKKGFGRSCDRSG